MGSSDNRSGLTRRSLLNDSLRVGAGAAAFALLGHQAARPAFAENRQATRVKVLVDDIADQAAEFSRGQAHGVTVRRAGGAGSARGRPGGELVSAPVALSFDATHLGLHWLLSEGGPGDLSVSVRTGRTGRAWSEWQSLEVEAIADRGGAIEVFATLADGGRGRLAQYRIEFGPGQAELDQMTVTAINSVDGPREALVASAPLTSSFTTKDGKILQVVTREGWGCDESLRFNGGVKIWPEMYVPAKKVVLHHTATANRYSDGAAQVRAVYTYQAQTQGWGDIGYNSLVDSNGRIYEGRYGRLVDPATREVLSADVVAGHALSYNYGSVGVAAIGNFDQAKPTAALLASIDDLFVLECGRHYIVPTAASDFLKSNDQWHLQLNNVSGHYESNSTKCPGRNLKTYLGTLKAHVSTRLKGQAPTTIGATSQDLTAPGSLSFSWSGPGPWHYCLEGWRRIPGSEDIVYLTGYAPPAADGLTSQIWYATSATSMVFPGLGTGHYTMHLLDAVGTYEANLTYLVTGG